MPSFFRAFITSVSLLAFSQIVYAQTPVIQVHPDKKKMAIDRKLDEATLRETVGNATLVDQDQWSGTKATTVKDITNYVPSIYSQNRNGAESSRLSIRGSGLANVFQGTGLLVLQDGVPINMADGEFEFPVIDPWLIDYAKIMPGANALAEGASTLGGAIDFMTSTAANAPGYTLRGEGGSFGTKHVLGSFGKTLPGIDLFGAASTFNQKGFRDNNEQEINRFNANLGWQSNDKISQRVYISHTKSNAEIPGAISKAAIIDNPSQANPTNIAGHFQRDLNITRIAHRAAWQDGNDRLETMLYYTYRTLDNPVTTYIIEDNNDGGARLKFTRDLGLDRFTTGLNIAYGSQNETRYANVNANKGARILDRNLYALNSEIYGQYDHHLTGGLFGVASLQAAYDMRNIEEETPTTNKQTKEYIGYSPRIGLRYDFDASTQFFTNLSRSFEPPTWSELSGGNSPGFNDLDEQTATTAEIGGRGSYGGLDWLAAIYRSHLKNEFINYRFADGSTDTINADKTIHDGFEFGLGGEVYKNISLKAAYTWSRFHLDGDPLYGDNQLPGMPEHYLRGELMYHHPSGFSVGPNIEWSPSSYPVDLTNSLKSDGYAVYGARMTWERGGTEFYLDGRNLTDEKYASTTNVVPDARSLDGRYFYPGEGRAVYAGVKLKF